MPELDDDMLTDDSSEPMIEEDAADRKERLRKQKEAEAAARLKLMSQPLQRGLPRPNHKQLKVHANTIDSMSDVEKAGAMVEADPLASLLPARPTNRHALSFVAHRDLVRGRGKRRER